MSMFPFVLRVKFSVVVQPVMLIYVASTLCCNAGLSLLRLVGQSHEHGTKG